MVEQVTLITERIYNVAGTTVILQNGVAAGQSVLHVHLHVIPRIGRGGGMGDRGCLGGLMVTRGVMQRISGNRSDLD